MIIPTEPFFPHYVFGRKNNDDNIGRPLMLELNIGDIKWDTEKLGYAEFLTFKDNKAISKKLVYDYVTNAEMHQIAKFFIYKIFKSFTPEELYNYKELVLYDEPIYHENRHCVISCNRRIDICSEFCSYGYLITRIPREEKYGLAPYNELIREYDMVCAPDAGFDEEYMTKFKRNYYNNWGYRDSESYLLERILEVELLLNMCKCDDKECVNKKKRRLAICREFEDILKQLKVELKLRK